jgi:hypothetical protein
MKLDLGAVARDTATGIARAWPWLVAAVIFRVACDWAEIWIDVALTEANPQREGLRSDSLGILIFREVLNGLFLGYATGGAVVRGTGVIASFRWRLAPAAGMKVGG